MPDIWTGVDSAILQYRTEADKAAKKKLKQDLLDVERKLMTQKQEFVNQRNSLLAGRPEAYLSPDEKTQLNNINKQLTDIDKQISDNKEMQKKQNTNMFDKAINTVKHAASNSNNGEKQSDTAKKIGDIAGKTAKAATAAAGFAYNKLIGGTDTPDHSAATLEEQARMHEQQGAQEGANAARNMQIANRDYRVEADKNAAANAAQQARNYVATSAKGNDAANRLAAAERTLGVQSDYNTQMQRQDAQRQQGVLTQREAEGARQTAAAERQGAIANRFQVQQQNAYNNMVRANAEASSEATPETYDKLEDERFSFDETAGELPEGVAPVYTYAEVQDAINNYELNNGIGNITQQDIDKRRVERNMNENAATRATQLATVMTPAMYKNMVGWLQKVRGGNIPVAQNTQQINADNGNTTTSDERIKNILSALTNPYWR